MRVLILRGETCDNDPNVDNIRNAFGSRFFEIEVIEPEKPQVYTLDTLGVDDYVEQHNIKQMLQKVIKYQEQCIIIKDSSIIIHSDLESMVKLALTQKSDYVFLNKYNDRCEYYGSTSHNFLKWTKHASSSQAFICNPKSAEVLLSLLNGNRTVAKAINKSLNTLNGVAFVPNIIGYDINLVVRNEDYLRLNECSNTKISMTENTNSEVVWFIAIFLLLILVGWATVDLFSIRNEKKIRNQLR